MQQRYLALLLFTLLGTCGLAQVSNDDCSGALALPEEIDYCSGPEAFSTVGATGSLMGEDANNYPVCFSERPDVRDVWFSFVAARNSVNIVVTGATTLNPGGTLRAPQFALYEGSCVIAEGTESVGCRSPFENPTTGVIRNDGNIIYNNLIEGETYYILVGARQGNTGTFELCVRQFDAVPEPSSDCPTGVVLCDKAPFAVDALQGNGELMEDLGTTIECRGFAPPEQNSSWYKWTCDDPGSLTFVITPQSADINEDIDWVLYELDDLNSCGGRTTLRQMFSGERNGQAPEANLPCLGETGTTTFDDDEEEDCGCDAGDNNFTSAINMVAGRSYALVIMNFSGSGQGFRISWGGTGTFLGPDPEFTSTTGEVCVGEIATFEDASASVDPIISWEWDFGPTAEPRTATGPGPHQVIFGMPGNPDVQLVIETDRSCREVAQSADINVICCQSQFTATGEITDLICPSDSSGAIDLMASSTFSPGTISYAWSTGAETEDVSTLNAGTYQVTISDASTCEEVFDYTVDGPPDFTFDTTIVMPDCGGATNGSFAFAVTGGGEGPYQYSLNGGVFTNTATLADIGNTTVMVTARDANGCLVEQDIEVSELELGLRLDTELFTEPVCAGDANGSITIPIANGLPAYAYQLDDGPFQSDSIFTGLAAGDYTVTARDADDCFGIFDVTITSPPPIDFDAVGTDLSCAGANDGFITLAASGGRPEYTITFADGSPVDSAALTDLPIGTYNFNLVDDNGCPDRAAVTLAQPTVVEAVLLSATDLICFNDSSGSFALSAVGGTPLYTYSTDGENFQSDSLLTGLSAGDYDLFVMDANGCVDSVAGALTEPREFIIDVGADQTISLGFDTILRATANYTPITFEWGPDSLLCLDPLCTRVRARPVQTTDYLVTGINAAGCTDTAMVRLNVIEDLPVYIPNAFSPDGDGSNDGFTAYGGRAVAGIESLRVYHRWGGLVFERENFPAGEVGLGWDGLIDGRPANAGVYVYQARVLFVNGSTLDFSGDVTLVR